MDGGGGLVKVIILIILIAAFILILDIGRVDPALQDIYSGLIRGLSKGRGPRGAGSRCAIRTRCTRDGRGRGGSKDGASKGTDEKKERGSTEHCVQEWLCFRKGRVEVVSLGKA